MANIVKQLFGNTEEKSQKHFSSLEKEVLDQYSKLVNEFSWRKNEEEKLVQIQEKTSAFYQKNEKTLSVIGNITEEKRMKTSRIAYNVIPVIDATLAFFPLLTIVEKEWGSVVDVPLFSYSLALGLGLFFSLIGRWTANALSSKTGSQLPAFICVLIVPSVYWINYIGFNNGTIIFTILFSLISGGLQLFIIYFFPQLHSAASYPKIKKKYEKLVKAEDAQKEVLAKHNLRFSQKFYNELWLAFHNLHITYQAHTNKYGNNPDISLSQILLCICNLAFFNYEAIPYRRRNGLVEGAALIVDIPELQDLFMTDEVRFFGYMLKQSGRRSQLTELLPQTTSILTIGNNGHRQLPDALPPQAPVNIEVAENEESLTTTTENQESPEEVSDDENFLSIW